MITAILNLVLRRTVKRWFEHETRVPDLRTRVEEFIARSDRLQAGWVVEAVGQAGGAPLYRIAPSRPPGAAGPLILYFHGGGYILGGLSTHAGFCARLGRALSGEVLFADYRLAPEHPFPMAWQDGVAAYQEAVLRAAGRPVLLAGDSAGGGLALAVAHEAMSLGVPPAGLVLISPWVDLTLSGATMVSNAATDPMLSMKILTRMRGHYLQGAEPGDRRASPLFDIHNKLPPVLILYSATEVLASDATRLADKLRQGGTAVTIRAWKGQPHVFPLLRFSPAAGGAMREIARFVAGLRAA